ncbi:MAG: TetR/AcrR family transcriptional regulator [Erythrobacter sp.]|uniref:TetR/AcrR family transcriptional regulator n=1 Tax=Erythrobacter sp. TaxID=1042 RepID=UPI0025D5AFB2|nr:TetR/AcrR family transcriptional regulator [Erythrobacter sp.]MCM0000704.1 TetR/AcrR family transcriptional regulator [Erythrobacter sp.]
MKRSEQKAATRAAILDLASRRLRAEGLAGNGVQRLMRDLGLTHGGFYVHFPSKQALDAAALEAAMAERAQRLDALPQALTRAERRKLRARRYLSRQHRDHPEAGCPLAALASEAPRAGAEVRDAFQRMLAEVVTDGDNPQDPAPPSEELALLALAAGGLALARAVPDPALSDAILAACRDAAGRLADAYADIQGDPQ